MERSSEQAADRASDRASERSSERSSDRATERSSDRLASRVEAQTSVDSLFGLSFLVRSRVDGLMSLRFGFLGQRTSFQHSRPIMQFVAQ